MGKIDGIIRDPETGIVLARRDKHPLADLFRALPAGSDALPVFNIPPEIHHLLAIHMFDNLDCSPPRNPLYKYRENVDGHSGLNGGMWVPIAEPDEVFAPTEAAAAVATVTEQVAPGEMSDAELAAAEALVKAEKLRRQAAAQADPVLPTGEIL